MPVIRDLQFFKALSPLLRPIADSTHQIEQIAFLVARLELETGTVGESYLLAFHYSPAAIAGALGDVRAMVLGWEVCQTGRFLMEFERQAEYFGLSGIHRWAQGLVNLAMWDAWGKTVGQPIWRMLGVYRDRVPLYGSGGWLSYSIDDLLAEVSDYVRRGFRAVKVKVGSAELAYDVERLTRVREAVGPQVQVMIDANQGMDLARALELAEVVRPLHIRWFEEPLPHTDFDGYAQLRRRAGIPLAMGEREFDLLPLREMVRRQAIDLWQPDILRLGGLEHWRASAAFAGAHHLPVLPHCYKEYDVPLAMTVPNALGVEWFDWVDPLLTAPIRVQDGFAYPNEGPGWGFQFKDEHLVVLRA
jgi:L-alanine-DL-glutamate epimerase-like enolase superfamily enzyme